MKKLILHIVITFFISSCCNKEKQYEFVKANCSFINYQEDIEIINKINITKCEIITIDKTSLKQITSILVPEKNISSWDTGIIKINLPEELATNTNWKIILNDSLVYNISDINVEVWGGRTTFCESYSCIIKDYRVNDSIVSSSNIILK